MAKARADVAVVRRHVAARVHAAADFDDVGAELFFESGNSWNQRLPGAALARLRVGGEHARPASRARLAAARSVRADLVTGRRGTCRDILPSRNKYVAPADEIESAVPRDGVLFIGSLAKASMVPRRRAAGRLRSPIDAPRTCRTNCSDDEERQSLPGRRCASLSVDGGRAPSGVKIRDRLAGVDGVPEASCQRPSPAAAAAPVRSFSCRTRHDALVEQRLGVIGIESSATPSNFFEGFVGALRAT